MRILQLCPKPPLPAKDGGCLATHTITKGLIADGHKVKILTVFTPKHDFYPENLDPDYVEKTQIEGVYIDTRVNAVDAFASFMTADSYNINRFFSTDFDIKLTRLLSREKFDIIHIESLFMTTYLHTIRRLSKAPIVLRAHNLEYEIWEKLASGTKNTIKKTYLKYLSSKLKSYELSMLSAVTGIAAISEEDKARIRKLGIKKPVVTIPFGIDVERYAPKHTQQEQALFHLGAMDWLPNVEGVRWFLERIWPSIHAHYPNLKLYLAGRALPETWDVKNAPNVIIVGEVEQVQDFMNSKSIMIVPLLSAGGMRVKIIEGLAMEKAIVSTTIGTEGIPITPGVELLVANTAEEWLKAIYELIDQPNRVKELGENGRKFVERHFDNKVINAQLVQFYKELKTK